MKKAMRIMTMVLFVVGMTTLTSCTKDNSDRIIGKWKFEKASASFGGESFELTAAQLASMMELNDMSDEFIIEFKKDGKVYSTDETEPANYKVDGDKLTIITPEASFEMIITELTQSKLIVEPQYDEEMPEGSKVEIRFKRA